MRERELRVLRQLRNDARMTLTDISRNTGIPVTTVFDYHARLQKVIRKNACIPHFDKLGYTRHFMIAEFRDRELALQKLENMDCVNNLFTFDSNGILLDFLSDGDFSQIEKLDPISSKLLDVEPVMLENFNKF